MELLDRDDSRHGCPVNGAVIVVNAGRVERSDVRALILCRRADAVVEVHAVLDTNLSAPSAVRVTTARAAIP